MGVTIVKKSQEPEVPFKPITLYRFGILNDGNADMKNELGGKGANLAEMGLLGIPVPSGFTIPCKASVQYLNLSPAKKNEFVLKIVDSVKEAIPYLVDQFGYMPLLSVRSGARVSMPGMMDTILNVGITENNLQEWSGRLGARTALDCYRRFLQMYGSVACGIDMRVFEVELEKVKNEANVTVDSELPFQSLKDLIAAYYKRYEDTQNTVPETLELQLEACILAVFKSWNNPRAIEYRNINGYSHDWGTAVNIQAMVFGNMDDKSCTGVVFTRDPSTGEKKLKGDWLPNAQGEDVVAGIRKTELIDTCPVLEDLRKYANRLEQHFKNVQDIEFTVQSGKLYILQTRTGKLAARASFRAAYDMQQEGLLTKQEALSKVNRAALFASMEDTIATEWKVKPDLQGLAAGGGIIKGVAVFSSADAISCTEPCILVTHETSPDDIAGMNKAVGILTATGGYTSHAAVVARAMNKVCVVGASDLKFSGGEACLKGMFAFGKGYKITIDGSTGKVWARDDVPIIKGEVPKEALEMMKWSLEGQSYAERITPTPRMSLAELAEAIVKVRTDTLYIDTAGLDQSIDVALKIQELGKVLGVHATDKKIIIDLKNMKEHRATSDTTFLSTFGRIDTLSGLKIASLKDWPVDVLSRTEVLLSPETPPPVVEFVKTIQVTQVCNFASLLKAKGPVSINDEVVFSVFGGREAFETAKQLVEKSNGVCLGIPTPLYWYEFLKEA